MVRNSKTIGILTTMKGWCFLWRYNGGRLYATRMYGDFPAHPPVTDGSNAEGYHATTNFTVMKALYYLSHISATTNDTIETPINGQQGSVFLPYASGDSAHAAPSIQQPNPAIAPRPAGQGGGYGYGYAGQGGQYGYQYTITGGYETADDYRQFDKEVDYGVIRFEPWVKENYLGPKNWIAKVVSNESKVVLKLWDAWKLDASLRDHELSIYLQLKSLWGRVVPSVYLSTPLEYFHALILQYVDVSIPSSHMPTVGFPGFVIKFNHHGRIRDFQNVRCNSFP
jgi:hypothetical protein